MTRLQDPIGTGKRIEQLLGDPDVQAVMTGVREANYRRFQYAESDEDRRMAQALAQALEALEQTFRSIIDAGTIASTEQEKRDRAPETR